MTKLKVIICGFESRISLFKKKKKLAGGKTISNHLPTNVRALCNI